MVPEAYKSNTVTLFLIAASFFSTLSALTIDGPSDTYGMMNQRITLRCSAKSNHPLDIKWYRNSSGEAVDISKDENKVELTQFGEYSSTLSFPLTKLNEDVYHCNVSNSRGWKLSKGANARIAFLNAEFSLVPVDKSVGIGETVLLECLPPEGLPKPTVRWEKNNYSVLLSGRFQSLGEGSLRIDKVSWEDSGKYVCIAESSSFRRHSPAAIISVHQRPYFVVSPASVSVPIHGSFELSCLAAGEPSPTVIWRREPYSPTIPHERSVLLTHGSLQVTYVQMHDAGVYVCRATNIAGMIEAVVYVSVISPPGFVTTPPIELNVLEGIYADIPCTAVGSPLPDLRWIRTDIQEYYIFTSYTNDDRIHVNEKGSLIMNAVRLDDSAVYECRASSSAGLTRSLTSLNVLNNPELMPARFGSISHNRLRIRFFERPVNVRLICDRPSQTSNEPLNVKLHYSDSDTSITWHFDGRPLQLSHGLANKTVIEDGGSILISNFLPSDIGNYTCVSYNRISHRYAHWNYELSFENYGESDSRVSVLQRDDLPSMPSQFRLVGVGDTWLAFQWNHTLELGDIGYQIFYIPVVLHLPDRMGTHMQPSKRYGSYSITPGQRNVHPEYDHWLRTEIIFQNSERIATLLPDTGYWIELRKVNRQGLSAGLAIGKIAYTTKLPSHVEIKLNDSLQSHPTGAHTTPLLAGGGSAADFQDLKATFHSISFRNMIVRSLTPTELLISWKTHASLPIIKQIEGFKVNVRPVPMSRCLATVNSDNFDDSGRFVHTQSTKLSEQATWRSPHCSLHSDFLMEQVIGMSGIPTDPIHSVTNLSPTEKNVVFTHVLSTTNPTSEAVVGNLKPFTCYEVDVEAYKDDATFGRISSRTARSELALTLDAPPSYPPDIVDVHWLLSPASSKLNQSRSDRVLSDSLSGIRIEWKPLSIHLAHGALVGYAIHILKNSRGAFRSVHVSAEVTSKDLFELDSRSEYTVYLSGITCRGEGVRSSGFRLVPLSLRGSQLHTKSDKNGQFFSGLPKWSLGLIGAFIFWLFIGLLVPLISRRVFSLCCSKLSSTPYCNSDSQLHSGITKYRCFCGLQRRSRSHVSSAHAHSEKPNNCEGDCLRDMSLPNGLYSSEVQMVPRFNSNESHTGSREYRQGATSNSTPSSGILFPQFRIDYVVTPKLVTCRDTDVYANTDPSDVSNLTNPRRNNSAAVDSCGSGSQLALSGHDAITADMATSALAGTQISLPNSDQSKQAFYTPATTGLNEQSRGYDQSVGLLSGSLPNNFIIVSPVQIPNSMLPSAMSGVSHYHQNGQNTVCIPSQSTMDSEIAYASCSVIHHTAPTVDVSNTQIASPRSELTKKTMWPPVANAAAPRRTVAPVGLVMSHSVTEATRQKTDNPGQQHALGSCSFVSGVGPAGHAYSSSSTTTNNNSHHHHYLSDTSSSSTGGAVTTVRSQQHQQKRRFCEIPPPPGSPPPPPPASSNRFRPARTGDHGRAQAAGGCAGAGDPATLALGHDEDCVPSTGYYASGGIYTEADNGDQLQPSHCANGRPVAPGSSPAKSIAWQQSTEPARTTPSSCCAASSSSSSSVLVHRCHKTLSPGSRITARTPLLGTGLVTVEAMATVHGLHASANAQSLGLCWTDGAVNPGLNL